MPKILSLLTHQTLNKPVTLAFPQAVPTAEGFRGLVENDLPTCVGCQTCMTVCPSRAIQVEQEEDRFHWEYDSGKCTFCAQCVQFCPVKALTQQASTPPSYSDRLANLIVLTKDYPRCVACGKPAHPVNAALLARVFPVGSSAISGWAERCEACRQLLFHTSLLNRGEP